MEKFFGRPDVFSSSKQAITLNFAGDFVTAVHASFDLVARRRLWRQLGLGFISIPWLVLGDFNCVLRLDEKNGGRTIKEIYMNEFGSWISDNGLVEADVIGEKYTWSNCRSGFQLIVSKHDRAIVNEAWPSRVPFIIQKMWFSHPTFIELVEENWNIPLQVVKVADAKKDVDQVRMKLAVMIKLNLRVTWLEDGDQNTRFFHNSIRMRRIQNTISELKISTNTTLFLQDEIIDYIVNHYQAKFNGGEVDIDPRLFELDSISPAESAFMDVIPSLEEVKEVVFDLGADSAPGPDIFTVKSAKAAIKAPAEVLPIATLFTRKVVHSTLSVQYWKIWAKQCLATEDNIIKKTGESMPTMCRLCRKNGETMSHILWHCRIAKRIWAWAAENFKLQPNEDLVASY
ncbi:uncharacterized protein LOC113352157 [Papaver somniferum]|uniref:uncharacterized protein LOC113352157 n=1 Tax=Papaver somniferum TaxID=3469 RepID=UPI000E704FE1|nr:uncharacterized protein LOC113352157 [Papaver somniferum]